MDNEKAKELNEKYATLLILDVPEGSSIGIDNKVWTSGPMFKGVKMLPPGVHMFHCTSSNEYGDSILISSSFIWVNDIKKSQQNQDNYIGEETHGSQQVFIKRWNKEEEDFFPDQDITEQDIQSYTKAVRNFEFDKNLAPYPFDGSQIQWNLLTSHITKTLLDRILPISNIINGDSCSYDQQKNNATSRKEKKLLDELDLKLKEFNESRGNISSSSSSGNFSMIKKDENDKVGGKSKNWGVPYFSKIPKNPWRGTNTSTNDNNDISNISKWNLDKSECVEFIINKYYKNNEMDLLGEIEFCFVLFIFGMTWSGFQQWKELVILLLGCDELVTKRPQLFIEFFKILKIQLQEAPNDMFESELSNRIFIKPLLKQFIESFYNPEFTNLEEMSTIQLQLFKIIIDLKNFLSNRFNWNLNLFNQIDLNNNNYSNNNNKPFGIKKEIKKNKKQQQQQQQQNDDDEDDEDEDEDYENNKISKNYQQNNYNDNDNDNGDDDYDSEDDEYKPVLVMDTDFNYL
ncbi:hypothetical protein RB653_001568 [Dictyostelium firmibasis]|uniref:AAR2-domain-containing protein n=1 Tax=Dictyostelium firmibasis TaxID=79012 RepID=A0AAN7U7I8_9MYCE